MMLMYVFFLIVHHLEMKIYILTSFFSSSPLNLQSFAAKGKFILETDLRGFSMWEAGGDFNDILLDSIREAGGYDDEEYCLQ